MPGSNRRPPACKAGALPTELTPRSLYCSGVAAIGSSPKGERGSVPESPQSLLPRSDGAAAGGRTRRLGKQDGPEGPSAVLVIREARPRPHPHMATGNHGTVRGTGPLRFQRKDLGLGARRSNSATAPTRRALRVRVGFPSKRDHRQRLAPAGRGDKPSGGSEPSDSALRGGPGSWGTRSPELTARGIRSS